ncbi:MAG: hypothetical protein WD156_10605 [Acidimicrobiia bacterium]
MADLSETGLPVETVNEVLRVNDIPLDSFELASFTDEQPAETTWRDWFALVTSDAFQYAQQRLGG